MRFYWKSYPKITLGTIKSQNFDSLSIKLSQPNFNLRSSDSNLVLSYLITTLLIFKNRCQESALQWTCARLKKSMRPFHHIEPRKPLEQVQADLA